MKNHSKLHLRKCHHPARARKFDTMLNKDVISAIDYHALTVSSVAFRANAFIPSKYTCDGSNISPSLSIASIPEEAKCLALIMDDPDAPSGLWVHWVAWNIPVTHELEEGTIHAEEGLNDFRQHHYGGPCPPSGTHRYFFKIYALNQLLKLPHTARKEDLEKAMSGSIIAFGQLVGLYKRNLPK